MQVIDPDDDFVTVIEDSTRWRHVKLRPDDIIISTPPKSGTTWTQGIVRSLLWPYGDADGTLGQRSPWIDTRFRTVDEVAAQVEAIEHRRFLKSHASINALPWSDDVRYLAIYRNPADSFVSWGNHRSDMAPGPWAFLNARAAEDGLAPMPDRWDGDWQVLYEEWVNVCNPATHLAAWWPRRNHDNVMLLHYANQWADLAGGMRAIADFLGIDVPDDAWPGVVERCTLSAMREESRATAGATGRPSAWKHGADSFYFKGGNGRGAELLSADLLARIDAMVEDTLPADAVDWLRTGGPLP